MFISANEGLQMRHEHLNTDMHLSPSSTGKRDATIRMAYICSSSPGCNVRQAPHLQDRVPLRPRASIVDQVNLKSQIYIFFLFSDCSHNKAMLFHRTMRLLAQESNMFVYLTLNFGHLDIIQNASYQRKYF